MSSHKNWIQFIIYQINLVRNRKNWRSTIKDTKVKSSRLLW